MLRRIDTLRRLEHQYVREQLREMELFPTEGVLLRLLDQLEPMRQEELVMATAIDKSAVARLLAHLEEEGLILRQISPQCRRVKLVRLTEKGRQKAVRLNQILTQWDDICYRGFTPEERGMNESFLERIAKNALDYSQGEKEHG